MVNSPATPELSTIDARSGFCLESKIFHSIRPAAVLPHKKLHVSIPTYVFSLLHQNTTASPSSAAFTNATTGETLTYSDLRSKSLSLASALLTSSPDADVGLSKGDVAFVLSGTCLEVPILYFALLSIGVVVCPSNSVSTQKEIDRQLELVRPTIAFATSATAHLISPNKNITVVLIDSDRFQSYLQHPIKTDLKEASDVKQSDTAVILFSSGTSGKAKAAALSHRSYIAMIAAFHVLRRCSPSRSEVMLLIAPMFHSLGFFFAIKGVALGDTTVVIGQRAGLLDTLRVAATYKVTSMTTSPPMVVAMSRLDDINDIDLSALKIVICGGAPLQQSSARRFTTKFPSILIEQGYGSTEGGSVAGMFTREECQNLKSVGRLFSNIEAKIIDVDTKEALPVGKCGELYLRSPTVMKGYLGDEKETSFNLDSGGWLMTGDLCYFDEEGYLYIVDRLKELIKYKAYQVPPVELEQVLATHYEIIDSAVVPYPDEESGQLPMAFVVKQKGSNLSESEIMAFVGKQVAPYKKIRRVVFVDSIKKTPSGKILRRELADQAISN